MSMTRKEIIKWWLENPSERKFKVVTDIYGANVPYDTNCIVSAKDGFLRWGDGYEFHLYHNGDDLARFEPIRELRKMSFGEACYYYYDEGIAGVYVICVETGQNMERFLGEMSKTEFMGSWTVEGIYEDDK